jgi:hypothetical protein
MSDEQWKTRTNMRNSRTFLVNPRENMTRSKKTSDYFWQNFKKHQISIENIQIFRKIIETF